MRSMTHVKELFSPNRKEKRRMVWFFAGFFLGGVAGVVLTIVGAPALGLFDKIEAKNDDVGD